MEEEKDNNVSYDSQNQEQTDEPLHNTAPENHRYVPPPNQYRAYNPYFSEPVGFDSYDKANAEAIKAAEEQHEKKLRLRRERTITAIFIMIFIMTAALSIYGIVSDVQRGKNGLITSSGKPVILYQDSKPQGANDLSNFVDENGKYTTEGAAAAVKSSIVEIYTYSDSSRNNLVGTGSGVVISKDGFIVTNAHVLQADGFHTIHTVDNNVYNVKIIGRDSKTDIAVIQASTSNLEPAVFGDSDEVMVGEPVIAVGNPAGLSNTVTDGIVSAVNRKIRSDSTGFEMDCIQTNADISPGNSGGALVNMYGQVIGITSSKYVSSSYEGLGFAITINEAKPIIEELISKGYVAGRFRIGITLIDMSSETKKIAIEQELGFELPEGFEGIYITSISEDSDIFNTALRPKDFITEINGKPVKTYNEFYDTISASYSAGDKVPAKCAHVSEDGSIEYYNIEFKLMEDTSGNY